MYRYQIVVIQSMQSRARLSSLRQELRTLANEVPRLVRLFMSSKPTVKGSVYELRRKCGQPNCKCQRGELHSTMVIASSEGGKKKLRSIPRGLLVEIKIKAGRYKRLRSARSQLIKMCRRMTKIMDEIEMLRREEMP